MAHDTSTFAGQVLHTDRGWVEVVRAVTLKECARAAALAYREGGRTSIGVRVVRLPAA